MKRFLILLLVLVFPAVAAAGTVNYVSTYPGAPVQCVERNRATTQILRYEIPTVPASAGATHELALPLGTDRGKLHGARLGDCASTDIDFHLWQVTGTYATNLNSVEEFYRNTAINLYDYTNGIDAYFRNTSTTPVEFIYGHFKNDDAANATGTFYIDLEISMQQ